MTLVDVKRKELYKVERTARIPHKGRERRDGENLLRGRYKVDALQGLGEYITLIHQSTIASYSQPQAVSFIKYAKKKKVKVTEVRRMKRCRLRPPIRPLDVALALKKT